MTRHEHAAHGPIFREDEHGNVAIDLHGWGHPFPHLDLPLLAGAKEPSTEIAHVWRDEFEAGARERAVSRAVAPFLPLLVAARRLAKSPTWSVAGEAYWGRKTAMDELRRALQAYDEATR